MTTDFTWNNYIAETDRLERKREVCSFKEIKPNDVGYKDYIHASHVLIHAKTDSISLNLYERKAIALMQMRFDGYLGFPGGLVDPGETPVEAANRELSEELGWHEVKGPVLEKHHQFTHVCPEKKLVLHFYAVEVTESCFKEIEVNALKASDHGDEVLGNVRVPLYTMGDAYRGFPCFLQNKFAGNAKAQLIEALVNLNIVTKEYVLRALTASPHMIT